MRICICKSVKVDGNTLECIYHGTIRPGDSIIDHSGKSYTVDKILDVSNADYKVTIV